VLDLVKTERYQPELVFDQASGVINCRNGELSYLDGEWQLGSHRRDRYLTTMIPVEYDPAAKAPRFNQFLFEVFKGDVDELEKIMLVGEALGYSLIPSCHLEKFFLLIGSGANGKSVLLGGLKDLLGAENVAAVKPSQFNSNFQRAYLQGMLANIVTEIEVGSQLADGLKALTSGEPITAEQKHRDPFTFTPFATQWLGTNHFPYVGDVSGGFTRRAIVLTFNQHFAEGSRDVHLAGKLRAELPGILNIALDGLARLYRNNRFTVPESCALAMRRWLSEVDQVSEFVEEECEEGSALEVESGALYAAFQSWAVTAGIQRRVTHKTFSSRLESRGFGRVRRGGGVRMITGLTVKGAPADFYQHREG
jgi:putative DNA primase/helicase